MLYSSQILKESFRNIGRCIKLVRGLTASTSPGLL